VRHAALVVLLMAVAGCTGLSGTPTETVSPAPVPAAEKQVVGDTPLPPGVAAAGAVDATTLAGAHAAAARNRSYRVSVAVRQGHIDGHRTETYRARVANRTTYLSTTTATGQVTRRTYAEEGLVLERHETTPPRYEARRPEADPPAEVVTERAATTVARYLAVDRAVVSATTLYGVDVVRIEGTNPREMRGVVNYEVVAYVEPSGFVRSLHVEYDCTTDQDCAHVSLTLEHAAVNQTTVSRPQWYDDALDASDGSRDR